MSSLKQSIPELRPSVLPVLRIITLKNFIAPGNSRSDHDPSQIKKGKVEFKGTTWDAISKSEIKPGERVVIIEKESITLIVEPKN